MLGNGELVIFCVICLAKCLCPSSSLSTFSSSLSIPRRADLLVETGRPLPAHQPPAGQKRGNVCVSLHQQSISSGAQNEVQTTTTTTPPQPLSTKVCVCVCAHTCLPRPGGSQKGTTQGGLYGGLRGRKREQEKEIEGSV